MLLESNNPPKSLSQIHALHQEVNKYCELVFNDTKDPIYVKDDELKILLVNDAFCDYFGLTYADIIGNKMEQFLAMSELEQFMAIEEQLLIDGKERLNEIELTTSDGQKRTIESRKTRVKDSTGAYCIIGSLHDISHRKRAEEKLKLAASVFKYAQEGIVICDSKGIIIDVNDKFSLISGYSLEESVGKNPSFLQSGRQSKDFYKDMWKVLIEKGAWSGEVWNRRKNHEVYAELININSIKDDQGNICNYVALFTDITPMKQHQSHIERIAQYDALTGLPNRTLLTDRISQAMRKCKRCNHLVAVVFLDLDDFKQVNDNYGHDVGDELLIALSLRMKATLRDGDTLSRIGGDEFVIVLDNLIHINECEPILQRLLDATSKPVTISDVLINVSVSIGATIYPEDCVDSEQLMRHADQSMYMAKDLGKNRYQFFDTAQNEAIAWQRKNLMDIRDALDKQQFELYYQPKVNMRTGQIIGSEALIRWQHPQRGLLNPAEFLPLIENRPMSIELGDWVIEAALIQINKWQNMEVNLPLNVSVNVAAIQLQQPDFSQKLEKILNTYSEVDPNNLEIEILETSAIDDLQHASNVMQACRKLGVGFALDDFGTGYSSLTYLRRLPADLIKIDQSFVYNILNDPDDLAIIEGVIGLAKSFKRNVIAEGVESTEHAEALLKLGCELAQGYGIACPMPANDFPGWVSKWSAKNGLSM